MNCECEIGEVTTGPVPPKLCPVHRRIALEMIDKCIWWPQYMQKMHPDNETVVWTAEEILVHLRAGRSRVEEGEPFDSYSTVE